MENPKEEPKQDYSGVHLRHCYQGEYEDGCKYGEDDCPAKPKEPKQETLEEATERYSEELLEAKTIQPHEKTWIKAMFIYIAKWQTKRMYSEEDLREAFRQGQDNMDYSDIYGLDSKLTEQEWFEQFKKK
jgi:hypothetical protein